MNMKFAVMVCLAVGAPFVANGINAQTRYALTGDGQEVSDSRTGLVWKRCAEGMSAVGDTCRGTAKVFTHDNAVLHAAAQAQGADNAWRLPSVKELSGIAEKSRGDPAINAEFFPATPPERFWSSSPHEGFAYFSGGVPFRYSDIAYYRRETFAFYVRLVRSAK